MARPAWAEGMREISPGVYSDRSHTLHLSEAELLEQLGWVDTAETRGALELAVADVFRVMRIPLSVQEG